MTKRVSGALITIGIISLCVGLWFHFSGATGALIPTAILSLWFAVLTEAFLID